MADKKEWKNASGFDNLPLIKVREEEGQETVGLFLGSRTYTDKEGNTQTVHKLDQNGTKVEFYGSGLLNWLLDPSNGKVAEGQEIKIVYTGLENKNKKPGKGNRHQFQLFVR